MCLCVSFFLIYIFSGIGILNEFNHLKMEISFMLKSKSFDHQIHGELQIVTAFTVLLLLILCLLFVIVIYYLHSSVVSTCYFYIAFLVTGKFLCYLSLKVW